MRIARHDVLLIGAGAAALTVAHPPFGWVWPAFVCLVPAALLILRGETQADPWRWRLHVGFWYGVVTQGVLLHWLAITLWRHGGVAVVLFPLAVTMLAGATAVTFAVVGRIQDTSPGRFVIALPASFILLEWVVSQAGPIALPWHPMALTVTAAPLLVQTADIAGAEGLGFLLVTINACIAVAWADRHRPRRALRHVEAAATIAFAMLLYGAHRLHTVPLDARGGVALVQPNASVDEKWRPETKDALVRRTLRLTEDAIASDAPDMIVWPETALPDPIAERPGWRDGLARLARRSGATVVVGGIEGPGSGAGQPSNAVFAFSPGMGPDQSASVLHRKQRLVPLVEHVPSFAPDLSRGGFGGFRPGRSARTSDGPLGRFGSIVCLELIFGDMTRQLRRSGAETIVVVSNDAWLSGAAPEQHFAHAALRAVESRVGIVRAANGGVSGIVDPLGRVVSRADDGDADYIIGDVSRARILPPALWLGGLLGPLCALLLLGLLARERAPIGRLELRPSSAP